MSCYGEIVTFKAITLKDQSSYLIHQVENFFYDNYGNQYNVVSVCTPNILGQVVMSNQEIDLFKSSLKTPQDHMVVNQHIFMNRMSNIRKDLDGVAKTLDLQNDMIQNLFHIVSNQQLIIENFNRTFSMTGKD